MKKTLSLLIALSFILTAAACSSSSGSAVESESTAETQVTETTALGAAMLAGRAVGLWDDNRLKNIWQPEKCFKPQMPATERENQLRQWKRAVEKAKNWVEE